MWLSWLSPPKWTMGLTSPKWVLNRCRWFHKPRTVISQKNLAGSANMDTSCAPKMDNQRESCPKMGRQQQRIVNITNLLKCPLNQTKFCPGVARSWRRQMTSGWPGQHHPNPLWQKYQDISGWYSKNAELGYHFFSSVEQIRLEHQVIPLWSPNALGLPSPFSGHIPVWPGECRFSFGKTSGVLILHINLFGNLVHHYITT